VGSAVTTFAIVLVRVGGFTSYLTVGHVLATSLTVSCLVVNRLIVDAARREAEARAEQAERARADVEQQADELRQQRASLHFQASVLSAVAQPVVATDPHGRVTYWNRAAEDQLGWTADELVGRRMSDVDPPPFDLPGDE